MSNLSQFFGGGGPSNIIRGSTSYTAGLQTINTGVFVDAATTYLSQGCRSNMGAVFTSDGFAAAVGSGSASARINGSGEVVVTSGTDGVAVIPFVGGITVVNTGVVDWEAIEYA